MYFLCNYITELYDQPNRPDNLQAEPEEEVDADWKGPYIILKRSGNIYLGNEG